MTSENTEHKATVWLGIAGGTLAILAFFGITSVDDLQNALDPTVIPCERAADALRANDKAPRDLTYSPQPLVEELRKAADASKDLNLQRVLRRYAETFEVPTFPEDQERAFDNLQQICWQ
ncbi:hypothetical protein [Streptomyces sp. NPDC058583]|uniref:hypothetical protein n=1 Tax=unclassified Streptomyces TaxID=2593676 RepID=UPI003658E754